MLKVYSKCKFTIGVRAHSNIFSFATSTPAIATYYDTKGAEFMRMIDSNLGVAVTVRDFYKNVICFIDTIMKNYNELENYLIDKKKTMATYYDRFIDRVCELLK